MKMRARYLGLDENSALDNFWRFKGKIKMRSGLCKMEKALS